MVRVTRTFSLFTKLEVVKKYDDLKSSRSVAKAYKISRNLVRSWVRSRHLIENAINMFSGNRVSHKRGAFPLVKTAVSNWIKAARCLHNRTSNPSKHTKKDRWFWTWNMNHCYLQIKTFKAKAIEEHNKHYPQTQFVASRGWLYRFLERNHFSLRRVTTTGRELPKDAHNMVSTFIAQWEDKVRLFESAEAINRWR